MRTLASGLLCLGFFLPSGAHAQPCEYPISDLTKCIARTPRAGHVATVSNPPCGPDGSPLIGALAPQGYGIASFKPACSDDDICYETCNTAKATCDRNFNATMEASCDFAFPYQASGEDEEFMRRGACRSRAHLYVRLVGGSSVGQNAYDDAQKKACECCRGWSGTLTYKVSGNDSTMTNNPPEPGTTKTLNFSTSAVVTGGGTMTLARTDDPNAMVMTGASGSWSQQFSSRDTADDPGGHCPYSTFSETSSDYSGQCVLPPESGRLVYLYVIDGVLDFGFSSLPGDLAGSDRVHTGGTVATASMPPACGLVMPQDVSTPGTGVIHQDSVPITATIDLGSPNHLTGTKSASVGTQPVRNYEVTWDFTHQ